MMRLENLAVASKIDQRDREVADLVERGRALHSEALPSDHDQVVGYVRRIAWTLNELIELMAKHQCLKDEP